jgi:biofilm PGA synthesis N-glycosyltransferase PgaC
MSTAQTDISPAPAPSVAVLIASKDGASTIGDTVASAAGQADVFVVSDGSTDDTVAVAEAHGAKVLALQVNVGKPKAVYTALRELGLLAGYDAVAILDDDTLIAPDFIERCLAAMTPDVAIVCGHTDTRWTPEHRWNVWLASRAFGYWRHQLAVRRGQHAFNALNCISGSNSMYRTSVLEQVAVADVPYIVDDTYWALETHRRRLGRIAYEPRAVAWVQDPLNLRDWYRQNLRWLWGTFQGIHGHRVGRRATWFDFWYVLLILDWIVYVAGMPALGAGILLTGVASPLALAGIYLAGHGIWVGIAAVAMRRPRLVLLAPAILAIDWIYRINFVHAVIRTLRRPRVAECRWTSPQRY